MLKYSAYSIHKVDMYIIESGISVRNLIGVNGKLIVKKS